MAGRFALFTDENVSGPVITGLIARGWNVVRTIEVFAEGTDDLVLFEHAAQDDRVMVSNDLDMLAIAEAWLRDSRPFRGLVRWERVRAGHFIDAFERYAQEADTFAYPIRHITAAG